MLSAYEAALETHRQALATAAEAEDARNADDKAAKEAKKAYEEALAYADKLRIVDESTVDKAAEAAELAAKK